MAILTYFLIYGVWIYVLYRVWGCVVDGFIYYFCVWLFVFVLSGMRVTGVDKGCKLVVGVMQGVCGSVACHAYVK